MKLTFNKEFRFRASKLFVDSWLQHSFNNNNSPSSQFISGLIWMPSDLLYRIDVTSNSQDSLSKDLRLGRDCQISLGVYSPLLTGIWFHYWFAWESECMIEHGTGNSRSAIINSIDHCIEFAVCRIFSGNFTSRNSWRVTDLLWGIHLTILSGQLLTGIVGCWLQICSRCELRSDTVLAKVSSMVCTLLSIISTLRLQGLLKNLIEYSTSNCSLDNPAHILCSHWPHQSHSTQYDSAFLLHDTHKKTAFPSFTSEESLGCLLRLVNHQSTTQHSKTIPGKCIILRQKVESDKFKQPPLCFFF